LAILLAAIVVDHGGVEEQELDDIVQRLAVAKYALAAHDEDMAREAIDAALEMGRRLLTARRGTSFVRSEAAPD
jgi:hypothetical protein